MSFSNDYSILPALPWFLKPVAHQITGSRKPWKLAMQPSDIGKTGIYNQAEPKKQIRTAFAMLTQGTEYKAEQLAA